MDGSFRELRWNHCLTVECLPLDAENVFMVVGVVMFTILEELLARMSWMDARR
jgi:hypothetical protein